MNCNMNIYEKNIEAFLEVVFKNRYEVMKIDRTYKYKKPKYTITLPTAIDYVPDSTFGIAFSYGTVGVYLHFTPHRNEIVLEREDFDAVVIESELLSDKYAPIVEALYHKKMNDNVVDFIDTTVDYLELKREFRNVKIKTIVDEKN